MEVWRCVKELELWKWADESDGSVEECGSVAKSAASSLSSKAQKKVFRVRDSRRRHWYTIVLHKKATVGPSVGSVACLPRRQPIV